MVEIQYMGGHDHRYEIDGKQYVFGGRDKICEVENEFHVKRFLKHNFTLVKPKKKPKKEAKV